MDRRLFHPLAISDLVAYLVARTSKPLLSLNSAGCGQPLTKDLYLTVSGMAAECGTTPRNMHRFLKCGALSLAQADRLCDHMRVHPAEIWSNYTSAVFEDIEHMPAEYKRKKGLVAT